MKERPILFSAPMVRAILEGRKTVTRRVVTKFPETVSNGYDFDPRTGHIYCHNDYLPPDCQVVPPDYDAFDPREMDSPYGEKGDRLWVRETWAPRDSEAFLRHEVAADKIFYRADDERTLATDGRWRPSIHMPRWASRITLAVRSVRVERLQEITDADVLAEGVTPHKGPDGHRMAFGTLWECINGKRPGCSWDDNPWVWRIEFSRIEGA